MVRTNAHYDFNGFEVEEKIMEREGSRWTYTVSGHGKKYLLAIVANMGGHLLGLALSEEFKEEYTTICLSCPPLHFFEQAIDGLKALLDAEGIEHCDAIGHSNGGVYLQGIIKKYPGTIEKVVFSHSLTSMSPEDVYTINKSEWNVYKMMRMALKILPVSVFSGKLVKMVLTENFYLKAGKDATEKLKTMVRGTMKKITKQDMYTMADCMEDFLFHYTFSPESYKENPENVLIIDSPTDHVANPMQRAEMLRLCPGAQEYHFSKGGHVTIINCRDEYFLVLHRFFSEQHV